MEQFKNLTLKGWRQFEEININFESQTTVLTGANGCGKTTILNVLSHHFGWNISFSATPFIGKKKKKKIFSDLRKIRDSEEITSTAEQVGEITYVGDIKCQLQVPANNRGQYTDSSNIRNNCVLAPFLTPFIIYIAL